MRPNYTRERTGEGIEGPLVANQILRGFSRELFTLQTMLYGSKVVRR